MNYVHILRQYTEVLAASYPGVRWCILPDNTGLIYDSNTNLATATVAYSPESHAIVATSIDDGTWYAIYDIDTNTLTDFRSFIE